MFGYCVGKEYCRKLCLGIDLAYWSKWQVSACLKQNLMGKGISGVESEGDEEERRE